MSEDMKEELIGGDDPCDRCNIPKRRMDFRHAELVRNAFTLGLKPPPDHLTGLYGSRV